MGFFGKLFGGKEQGPLIEYPGPKFANFSEALLEGIRRFRTTRDPRPIVISWQGQGAGPDSYHIEELRMQGPYLDFLDHDLDLENICSQEGLNYGALKGRKASELNVSSLPDTELAHLIQNVFTKHLNMQPWEDSGDYCLGFEYETEAGPM